MATLITGGCMCGAVRYECSAEPMMSANCYCKDCQRSSGGALASVLVVPKEAFKLTKGEPKHYEVTADSGNKVSRGFCTNCGSPILSLLTGMPNVVAIKAGSLDDPASFKPPANVYMASAPAWAPVRTDLRRFEKMPS
jgi:hypothetical protein